MSGSSELDSGGDEAGVQSLATTPIPKQVNLSPGFFNVETLYWHPMSNTQRVLKVKVKVKIKR